MIERTVDAVQLGTPPTVAPDATLAEAAQHLREPGVAALPVLDDGAVVGIVTESDVVALVAETAERPTVGTFMSTPVRTVAPTTSLPAAAGRMRTAGVKHLPVTDDGGYRGLLSAGTLAPHCSRRALDIEWQDDPLCVDAVGGAGLTAGD